MNTLKPKISVLLPVFNGEKYLKEAIDSIISQTFTEWELVIINDGSTDASEKIILSYTDERIVYTKNEKNIGLISTLNKGVSLCKTKYIARMDADDVSHPERLRIQYDFLTTHPEYILCGTDAQTINKKGDINGKIVNFYDPELLKIHLLFSVPIVHPSVMICKEYLQDNPYNADFKHVEDYELWTRLSKKALLTNINQNLLYYRLHETNVSVENADYQMCKKAEVQTIELQSIGITPTEEELYYHNITFQLQTKDIELQVNTFEGVEAWFDKLIQGNAQTNIYDKDMFIAFLWSRWMVLCLHQNKKIRAMHPSFRTTKPKVVMTLYKILKHLNNKR